MTRSSGRVRRATGVPGPQRGNAADMGVDKSISEQVQNEAAGGAPAADQPTEEPPSDDESAEGAAGTG